MSAFFGGFFEHRDWPIRRALGAHESMRAVIDYEAKYVNVAGYWCTFNQAAIGLRQEASKEGNNDLAGQYDVWSIIAVRYSLRVLGIRTQFYRMAAVDPVYAKMILPALERRAEVPASDDLDESLLKLEGHMNNQLMKAVATLSASNATRRAGGGAPAAGGN